MTKLTDRDQSSNIPLPKPKDSVKLKRVTVPYNSMIHSIILTYYFRLKSALGKRSAALGYGIKSDFTKHDKYIPGPTTYTV